MTKKHQVFFCNKSSDFSRDTYIEQEAYNNDGLNHLLKLGPYNTRGLIEDPKRFGFMISRHKFVSKMLDGCKNVLEVGCQEGLGTLVVSKAVEKIVAVDFYKPHIEAALAGMAPVIPNASFMGHDIIDGPVPGRFDGAFTLDVFEHIDPGQADTFMQNIAASLTDTGVLIVGIPSLESQKYASKAAAAGHINCRTGPDLRDFCHRHFHNVFMFGMNDEVLHTGFMPMCHYLFAICVGPRR